MDRYSKTLRTGTGLSIPVPESIGGIVHLCTICLCIKTGNSSARRAFRRASLEFERNGGSISKVSENGVECSPKAERRAAKRGELIYPEMVDIDITGLAVECDRLLFALESAGIVDAIRYERAKVFNARLRTDTSAPEFAGDVSYVRKMRTADGKVI